MDSQESPGRSEPRTGCLDGTSVLCTWLGGVTNLHEQLAAEGVSSGQVPVVLEPPVPSSDLSQLLGLRPALSLDLSIPTLVRFTGMVHMLSAPRLCCYSRAICCAACSTVQRVDCTGSPSMTIAGDTEGDSECDDAGGGRAVVCCEMFRQGGEVVEDLSQRVMMPCRQAWVSPLSRAAGELPFAVRQQSVRVQLADDLAGAVQLGDIVEVFGTAAVQMQAGDTTGRNTSGMCAPLAVIEVEANNITRVVPHACWLSGVSPAGRTGTGGATPPSTARGRARVEEDDDAVSAVSFQLLCDLLEAAQGSYIPAHLCLALLASAAAVSSAKVRKGPAGAGAGERATATPQHDMLLGARMGARLGLAGSSSMGARPTINLLLGVSGMDPTGLRLLQGTAALLSPHSVSLGPHMEDPILPRVAKGAGRKTSEGEDAPLVVSSVFTGANRGILCADASLMSVKDRAQLADLLPRTTILLPHGAGTQTPPPVPVTATVWAVASYNTGAGGSSKRQALGWGPTPMAGVRTGQGWGGLSEAGFDLLLLLPEDNDAAAAHVFGATAGGGGGPEREAARTRLRNHMAHAVLQDTPQLTDPCLSLLSSYIVAVRQSMLALTQADLVGLLVKVATAFARLMLREQVMVCPDCVFAVLLVEDHLACRFGDAYMGLGLPRLSPRAGNSMDDQAGRLLELLTAALKGYIGADRVEQ
ncbi:MAG: hypothetical protein WDW36_005576 [Sanguina aurantia]